MSAFMEGGDDVGDAVDFEQRGASDETLDFDVVGCRFAEFFRELGEPELGFAMLCSFDDELAEEAGGGEVTLTRTGTIMTGAERCDFRYALRSRGLPTT